MREFNPGRNSSHMWKGEETLGENKLVYIILMIYIRNMYM